jgi:hypothetical protein
VNKKQSEGYTPAEDGTPYRHSAGVPSGIAPQLLNPIDELQATLLMRDLGWCVQIG